MYPHPSAAFPLVSIIIPCYNQGEYLFAALASIWKQTYPAMEVIVVDDGSTDTTKEVATAQPAVKYIYQSNQGPSMARNTGVAQSSGDYVVFLDADDWLLPDALHTNVAYLSQHPEAAFVSGGHRKVYVATGATEEHAQEVSGDHYFHLLHGNYIGMLGTVMFQRWIFNSLAYDPQLRGSEDYDLYLRIARTHPVVHHTHLIAAYRIHGTNTSADAALMLNSALAVLERQHKHLQNRAEKQAYERGQMFWQDYYNAPQSKPAPLPTGETEAVKLRTPTTVQAIDKFLKSQSPMLKQVIKKLTPDAGLKLLHRVGVYKGYVPAVGHIALGDFARTTPFSNDFGYDRGDPIDRYYIERFLQEETALIQGRVLEIGDNEYTLRFGTRVTKSDILHVDASNSNATFVGDLSNASHIPDEIFDCIVLTQTLHLIYDYKAALKTCHRILKPGGTLLLTVPGISPIDRGEWKKTWYWSFTDKALLRLLPDTFASDTLEVNSFGNVLVASAFLYGMSVAELTQGQLEEYDPQFQVINTVKAVKAYDHA